MNEKQYEQFLEAAKAGDLEKVKDFVEKKSADVNFQSVVMGGINFDYPTKSHTALHMTLDEFNYNNNAKERLAVAKYLIKKGADVNALGMYGKTPLHEGNDSDLAIVKLLLKAGANIKIKCDEEEGNQRPYIYVGKRNPKTKKLIK